jgi:hypothetical protein
MWQMMIIEYDHYIDPKTNQQRKEEVERYCIRTLENLADFLLNVKKDIHKHPEFFCSSCGFWTSYQLVLMDEEQNIVGIRNLFDMFREDENFNWNFENMSLQQLREILAAGLT